MDTASLTYDLFPPIEPFGHGMLSLDGGHHMYWEQSGNPDGTPVLFLHGGPGAGASATHRRFFDPAFYRIVVFDQRGAGRSRPFAGIEANTTAHLVADIEVLRRHLGLDRWLVFGGSWGASLALAYGLEHPARLRGFVLRGVFLCRAREIDWFFHGIGGVFPEAWHAFASFLPEAERGDLLGGYHRRLVDPDPARHLPAAYSWNAYESACSSLLPRVPETTEAERGGLDLARIEAHYFKNRMFMAEGYLLAHVGRLKDIPCVIVQGRYDMICPAISAFELARAWPGAELVMVADAGHSAMEPGIRSALVRATEGFKARL